MKQFLLSFLIMVGVVSSAFGQVAADFYGVPLTLCNPPYEVSFYNLSANYSSIEWDFGDGNTSTLPQVNHLYMNPGTYTVTLIAFGAGGTSDTMVKVNYVQVNTPIPAPTVNQNSVMVNCGGSEQFVASGGSDIRWYDNQDNLIARGDTLNLPSVTNTATYFVRSEQESAPMFTGPEDPDSVGGGGYFNGNQGLIFEVLGDIRLKSVLVDANGTGLRTFTLTDTFGITLQILSVFVPDGKSRINLDLPLIPGNYILSGDGVDLFRNNNSMPNYPFTLPGAVTITGATAGPNFYYFFYDWEVVTYCQSVRTQVDVMSTPIADPVATMDTFTVNCGSGVDMVATSTDEVQWFDLGGNLVNVGDTFSIPFAGGGAAYVARSIAVGTTVNTGPASAGTLGNPAFYSSPDESWLLFDVYSDMTLHSVLVDAGSTGSRDIEIIDDTGNAVGIFTVNIPAGPSRVTLDVDLAPGSYLIGGSNLNLTRNDSVSVNYPYAIPGIVVITAASEGRNTYNFFYDWEVSASCVSSDVPVALKVLAPAAPTVGVDSMDVMCEGNATFMATGTNVSWYDAADNLVTQGNALNLTSVTSAATYFARTIEEGTAMLMDPVDPVTLGTGGFHSNAGAYLEFDALSSIRIKSVWVDAGSAGDRDIELLDGGGNLLRTVTVTVPAGQSRITLDLEMEPGSYSLGGANMDLYRNNDGPYYPFSLAGLVNITGSSAGANFYYYLYNWEVVSLCRSASVPVNVDVLPLAAPTVTATDTVCYLGSATFTASSTSASWYDPNGVFVGVGGTLVTPPLTLSGTYSAIGESMTTIQKVGPIDNTIGGGGYFNGDQGLEFTVISSMRLNSAWVDAQSDGIRDIIVEDGGGNVIQTISVFIPAGQGRIGIGLSLQPGNYTIRGSMMDLYRNNGGAPTYPYDVAGLVSITGATAGQGFYYFFYDWEVQAQPCESDPVTFDVTVKPEIMPGFTFSQNPINTIVTFTDITAGATSWNWDFGDGGTSTSQNPSHAFLAPGFYIVTLDVVIDGCDGSLTDTIQVNDPVIGIEDLLEPGSFLLYPNPGTGRFTVEATAVNPATMELRIFDLTGHEVFATNPVRSTRLEEAIDLSGLSAGSYLVQLKVDGASVMKKWVKM